MQEIRLEYVHRSQTYLTASHSQLCYFCYFLISGRDDENNGFLAGVPLLPPPSRPNSLPLFFRTPATQAKQTKNGFATEHLHISHNTPCLPPKILHNLKFFIVLGLQLSQENWRQCQLMFLRFVFFLGGGGEGGRGASKVHYGIMRTWRIEWSRRCFDPWKNIVFQPLIDVSQARFQTC